VERDECARRVVAALETALTIHDQGVESVEETRRRTGAVRAQLDVVLALRRKGLRAGPAFAGGDPSGPSSGGRMPYPGSPDELSTVALHGVRWETALCDCAECLMRLYAYPEAREAAERISALLRTLRLLQVSEFAPPMPQLAPSFPGSGENDPADTDPTPGQMNPHILRFFEMMDDYLEEYHRACDERMATVRRTLEEAVSEARSLAAELGER
jgi:hypothetical protein